VLFNFIYLNFGKSNNKVKAKPNKKPASSILRKKVKTAEFVIIQPINPWLGLKVKEFQLALKKTVTC